MASVAQWCGLEALTPVVPTDSVDTEIVAAKTAQLEIGWANFLKGRVSAHWATAQTMFLNELYPMKQVTTSAWPKGLISVIWRFFTKVWIARCTTLHKKANM
eukprot:6227387-Ditylum_brightwellii.AAC.1